MSARRQPSPAPLIPGAAIKGFRARHRLSQTDLGELLGVSGAWVHYLETGARPVPHRTAIELARLFDAPVSELARPVIETLDEHALLLAFRHLGPKERAALLAMVRS